MGIPQQRRPGQTGGAGGQRANRGTFRGSGGNVKPPSKGGCALWLVGAVGTVTALGYGVSQIVA